MSNLQHIFRTAVKTYLLLDFLNGDPITCGYGDAFEVVHFYNPLVGDD